MSDDPPRWQALARSLDDADAAPAGGATGTVQGGCCLPPGTLVRGTEPFRRQALAALRQLQAVPTGAALLQRIARSGRTCVIMESLEGNTCGYTQPAAAVVQRDGRPGAGTNSVVRFNPALKSLGPLAWHRRAPAIALGHELIHGLHAAEGTIDRRPEPNDHLLDEDGDPMFTKYEELRTVGVPPHDDDPITENALRREWPAPHAQRPYY